MPVYERTTVEVGQSRATGRALPNFNVVTGCGYGKTVVEVRRYVVDRSTMGPEERHFDMVLQHLLTRHGLNRLGVPYLA